MLAHGTALTCEGRSALPLDPDVAAALRAAGLDVREDEPLLKKTWWRVGGPADGYVEVASEQALATALTQCAATACPVFVLGNASNLLISDRGIRGLVLRLVGDLARARAAGPDRLVLGGGLKLVGFVRQAMREGWTGLEMLAGIPGTVGGAVVMNAGTRLGEVADRLEEVGLVLPSGEAHRAAAADLGLGYRRSALPRGAVVSSATFSLTGEDPARSRALVEEHLGYRERTQPTDVPTCGSTFRNPKGDHAGRLIEATGLKGHTVGAAQVSPKHANFLVNLGGATAEDIRALIETVRARVHDTHGVWLQPEVHLAGDWDLDWADAAG